MIRCNIGKSLPVVVFFIGVLFIITAIFIIVGGENKRFFFNKIIYFNLNGKKYRLLVADKEKEWERGLMFHRHLGNADGMVFIFPSKEYRTFWNKNTYLNLNIFWLDDEKVVGEDILPSIDRSKKIVVVHSPKKVNKVVEVVNNK